MKLIKRLKEINFRKHMLGEYGIQESAFSIITFSAMAFMWYSYYVEATASGASWEKLLFPLIFVTCMCITVIALPIWVKCTEKIPNETLIRFFAIPQKHDSIQYSDITSFLSDQALASFLLSILIFTSRSIIEDWGHAATTVFTIFFAAPLYVLAIIIAVMSLIRFVAHFTHRNKWHYLIASSVSTGAVFCFINIGLKMVA